MTQQDAGVSWNYSGKPKRNDHESIRKYLLKEVVMPGVMLVRILE
jgi:hypothetical protein